MARELPILWDVAEEHLEEAAFLWQCWERALVSPIFTAATVAAGPEERLLAHLDALAVGGAPVARRLLEPALAGDDAGKAFAAAWVLLGEGREAAILEALKGAAEPPLRDALRRALELSDRPAVDAGLLRLAAEAPPAARASALEALAFRGVDPGDALRAAAVDPDPSLRTAALRAARCSRAGWVPSLVARELGAPEAAVRDAAIETGLVLGLRDAWAACCRAAAAKPASATAMLLVALGGDDAEQEPLLAAAAGPAPDRAALVALGHSGRIAAADASLAAVKLDDPGLARLGGEAFSAITGLAIAPPYQAPEPPAPDEPIPFHAEDLDRDLAEGPEAELPLPDPGAVETWWRTARSSLAPGARLLDGRPRDAAAVLAALAGGPARRRHALALELEIRSRGALRPRTRGLARAQRLPPEGLGGIDLARPFRALARGV